MGGRSNSVKLADCIFLHSLKCKQWRNIVCPWAAIVSLFQLLSSPLGRLCIATGFIGNKIMLQICYWSKQNIGIYLREILDTQGTFTGNNQLSKLEKRKRWWKLAKQNSPPKRRYNWELVVLNVHAILTFIRFGIVGIGINVDLWFHFPILSFDFICEIISFTLYHLTRWILVCKRKINETN